MIALLLAQLVLPGPPSGPIQPPGMICLGACAGPVIYGPAERGRLVVACDMTSDTCSDGRKITTVRASPVPCEVAPGQWEMVPEDTGCYSVRGLESWAANTSYLAYGADLTNTAWSKQRGMSVDKVGSVYRIRRNKDNTAAAFVYQDIAAVTQQETWTAACVMRAGTATVARLSVDRGVGSKIVNLTSEWQVFANTRTLVEGRVPGVSIGPEFTAGDSYIEVAGCWLTKSDTPGRACWGGEAPVTCAADRHTIGTEGWPTESGRISLVYVPADGSGDAAKYLLDSRVTTDGSGLVLYRSPANVLIAQLRGSGTVSSGSTNILQWVPGRAYLIDLIWSRSEITLRRDGEVVAQWVPSTVPDAHRAFARIGESFWSAEDHAQGSLGPIRIRSSE